MTTNNEYIRTVEINGVKMDIDLRTAVVRTHSNLAVGSYVKVLTKTYSGHEVKTGVVIGFDEFKAKPTIIIAYLSNTWDATDVSFLYYNEDTKETEVLAVNPNEIMIDGEKHLKAFDRAIVAKQAEIRNLEAKREFFLKHFGQVIVSDSVDA